MKRQERINISLISSPDSFQEAAAVPSSAPAGAHSSRAAASIAVSAAAASVAVSTAAASVAVAVAVATMKRQERINISLISSPDSLQEAAAVPSSGPAGAHSSRASGAPADARTASSPIDVDIVRTKVPRKPRTPRLPVAVRLEDEEEDEEVELTASGSGASREESSHSNTRKRQKTLAGITIINCENLDENDSLKRQDVMKSAPPPPKESTFSCPICMHALEEASVTKCGHIFCEKCIRISIKRNKKCPLCAHKLTTRRGFHRIYFPASE